MDIWAYIFSPSGKEISATLLLIAVVVSIFTGLLVPGRTHNRELKAATDAAEQHRSALEREQQVTQQLVRQNSTLLAAVRIADHFYGDFLEKAPPDEGGS